MQHKHAQCRQAGTMQNKHAQCRQAGMPYLHNGVCHPDVAQEHVAHALPCASSLHQPRNVHKLKCGGDLNAGGKGADEGQGLLEWSKEL